MDVGKHMYDEGHSHAQVYRREIFLRNTDTGEEYPFGTDDERLATIGSLAEKSPIQNGLIPGTFEVRERRVATPESKLVGAQ